MNEISRLVKKTELYAKAQHTEIFDLDEDEKELLGKFELIEWI